LIEHDEVDLIAELERMDRFFDGEEAGEIPLEVLRANGIDIPALPPEDAAALRAKLFEIIDAMFEIGMVVESTDHLSDAELYRFLVDDALLQETILDGRRYVAPQSDRQRERRGQQHLSPLLR